MLGCYDLKKIYEDKESGWPIFGSIPTLISHSVLNMNSVFRSFFLRGFCKVDNHSQAVINLNNHPASGETAQM